MIKFTEEQLQRYNRHILLEGIGIEGQEKILEGKVLIIGAGGLGSPMALYLAAAGVGAIGIADADRVDISNLQRQFIHSSKDIDRKKVESAAEKMRDINPDVVVKTYYEYVRAANIGQIIADYDFVIDATDNFATKFLINDACVMAGKPFSHGGVLSFHGQTMTILPGQSACYRCVFFAPPPLGAVPTSSQVGILGAVAGIMGSIQAAECLKYLTKTGDLLVNSLLFFDIKTMTFRKVDIKHNKNCPICGDKPTIIDLVDAI